MEIKNIATSLSILKSYIKMNTKLNLSDICIVSEDFFCGLLNVIYGYNLINSNILEKNFKSVDLLDEDNKLVYQVTADNSPDKVRKTITKFISKFDSNYKLKFIILADKKEYRAKFDIPNDYVFDKTKDIYFIEDFVDIIKANNKVSEAANFIKESFYIDNYNRDYDWFKENNENSILDLGCRYNKELNVDVPIYEDLTNFLPSEVDINYILNSIRKVIVESNRWIGKIIEKENLDKLKEEYLEVLNNYKIINIGCLKELLKIIGKDFYEKKQEYLLTVDEKEYYNKRRNIDELFNNYEECIEILDSLSKKVMIITGKMGTGKSHMLAYFVENYCINNAHEAIFILGQHLNEEKNYKLQIKDILELNETFENFIRDLNAIGKEKNTFIPFIIDAINEGKTKENWKNQLNSIISLFEKYDYVKLILSIREDYYDVCIPDDIDKKIVKIVHHSGFDTNAYDAMNEIFNYYNVPIPLFPVINDEYSNPLFLISTCKWIRDYNINILLQDYQSFETIFEKFIKIINDKMALKYKFSSSNKLLDEIFNAVSIFLIDNSKLSFTKKEFCDVTRMILQDYHNISPINLLDDLKSEGLLFESYYSKEPIYYFAFEKYTCILNSKTLVNKTINNGEINKLELKKILNKYIYDIELLKNIFIKIGNDYGIEYFDVYDSVNDDNILYSYIKSLVWRKKINFDTEEKFTKFINQVAATSPYSIDAYNELFYYCAAIESSPFNINKYNEKLLKMSLPERDYRFTIYIDYEKSINIIKYCLYSNMQNLGNINRLMLGITLSWFLVSPNREIRDLATKALVNIMTDNIGTMLEVLKNFKTVNDMYVMERIYAACYGAILRSDKKDDFEKIFEYIYSEVFLSEEVIPNIVVRYYAKNILIYIKRNNKSLKFDEDKITAPYNSKWYENIPTNNDIKKYKIDYNMINKENLYLYSQNSIIHSMLTESAGDLGMYGDFGRYYFGHIVSPWIKNFSSEQDLSNIVIKRVFEMGYDVEKFGHYDRNQTQHQMNRHVHTGERIGKKYQWIAMNELVAKLQDNYYCYFNVYDNEIYEPSAQYFTYDMEETEDIKKARYKKKYYEECESQLLNIDVTNLINIPEKNLKTIKETIDDNWTNNNINEKEFIETENEIVLSFFGKYEKEKLDLITLETGLYHEYSYHASLAIIFQAYLYKGELLLSENELQSMFAGTTPNYEMLMMEYPWKVDNKIEFNKEREDCFTTNYRYNYSSEYDHTVVENGNNSIELPSIFLIDKLKLKQNKDGYWCNADGEIVCYDKKISTGETKFVIKKDKLIKLLKENNLNIVWMGFVEKKYNKMLHEYKYMIKLTNVDTKKLSYEKYHEDGWKIKY